MNWHTALTTLFWHMLAHSLHIRASESSLKASSLYYPMLLPEGLAACVLQSLEVPNQKQLLKLLRQ